ncbi:MAG: DUF4282 domain-containing protein [Pseudomonadota bacterium]
MAQGGWNPPPGGYGPPGAPPPGGYGPPGGAPPGAPPGGPGGYGAPGGPPGGYGGAPGGPPGGYAPQQPPPQYQPPMGQHLPLPSAAQSAALAKGFFAGLFDFSFETFVALKVIKVLYGVFLLVLALGILGGIGAAIISIFQGSILAGLGMLIAVPIAALVYLVVGRVYFELVIVAFKIAEDADEIARNTRK